MITGIYLRLAIAAAIVIFLAGTLSASHWKAYTSGKATVRAEWAIDKQAQAEAALAASEAARAKEQALTTANERIKHALAKEKADRVAATTALDDSLRQLQAALGSPASGDSKTGAGTDGAGGLESELLGNCAQTLAGLAGTADRLEAKIVGLQGYVAGVVFGAIDGKTPPVDYTIKPPAK